MPETTPYHLIAAIAGRLRAARQGDEATRDAAVLEEERRLDLLASDLDEWSRKVQAVAVPAEAPPEAGRLLEASLQGLDCFRQALSHLRAYPQAWDDVEAEQALARGREGIELILRVRGFAEDRIEQLLDEAQR